MALWKNRSTQSTAVKNDALSQCIVLGIDALLPPWAFSLFPLLVIAYVSLGILARTLLSSPLLSRSFCGRAS